MAVRPARFVSDEVFSMPIAPPELDPYCRDPDSTRLAHREQAVNAFNRPAECGPQANASFFRLVTFEHAKQTQGRNPRSREGRRRCIPRFGQILEHGLP